MDKQTWTDHLTFLAEYAWIYNFQLTQFVSLKVWERIPNEWVAPLSNLTNEQLNDMPYNYIDKSWPASLVAFLEKAHALASLCKRERPNHLTMGYYK